MNDMHKLKSILIYILIFTLIISAGLISQHNDSSSQGTIETDINRNTSTIYVCDRYTDLVATDEIESRSRFVSTYSGQIVKVIRRLESNQIVLLICLSISLAVISSAACYAVTEAKQSCLYIINLIQKKDGKK